jgi:hypothetical protein
MAKSQFRVQLDDEDIQQMERLASEYGYRGASAVGSDIIQKYLTLWADLKRAEKALLEQQRGSLLDNNRRLNPTK